MRRRGLAALCGAAALVGLLAWWVMLAGEAPSVDSAVPLPEATPPRLPVAPARPDAEEVQALRPDADRVPADPPPPRASPRRAREALDGHVGLDADGWAVSGRVLGDAGEPLAGARVLLVTESWGQHGDFLEMESDRDVTDADGRFVVRPRTWDDPFEMRLRVALEGWPPWEGRVEPCGGSPDVHLGPVQWLPLQVLFEDGVAVAEADLRLGDSSWEQRSGPEPDIVAATTVGRTDSLGRALLPVREARRDLSLIVEHPLHAGRHAVPLAEWREDPGGFAWTLTVPREAAFELQLTDWPGGRDPGDSNLRLVLDPYRSRPDGSLELEAPAPFGFPSRSLVAEVRDGRALVGRLSAPAYRIVLRDYREKEVVEECWLATPGLSTRPWLTPRPSEASGRPASLTVEVALTGDSPDLLASAPWAAARWELVAADDAGHQTAIQVGSPGWRAYFGSGQFTGPVTLALCDLGVAGTRTGAPPAGRFLLELDAEAVRAAMASVRVELSGLSEPPRPDKVELQIQPEGSNHYQTVTGPVAHGLRPGSYSVRVRARGVDPGRHAIQLAPGATAVVRATDPQAATTGVVRGRLVEDADAGWLRLAGVEFTEAETGALVDASPLRLGLRSFSAELPPGRYSGALRLSRLTAPEATEARLADVHVLPDYRYDMLPIRGAFACEVRVGEVVDLEVPVDISVLALVSVTAPALAESRRRGTAGEDMWYASLFSKGADEESQSAWIGRWPDEPVSLRIPAGEWLLVAERNAERPSAFPDRMEARFAVTEGMSGLDVSLEPAGAEAAGGAAR